MVHIAVGQDGILSHKLLHKKRRFYSQQNSTPPAQAEAKAKAKARVKRNLDYTEILQT